MIGYSQEHIQVGETKIYITLNPEFSGFKYSFYKNQ
jgi:hypothetical protein